MEQLGLEDFLVRWQAGGEGQETSEEVKKESLKTRLLGSFGIRPKT